MPLLVSTCVHCLLADCSRVQEEVYERFWEDCVLKIRNVGVPEMSVNKQLVNLQRVAFLAMKSYDEGEGDGGGE